MQKIRIFTVHALNKKKNIDVQDLTEIEAKIELAVKAA